MEYAPFQRWWNFVHCQNFQGRYEVGKPETALKCANILDDRCYSVDNSLHRREHLCRRRRSACGEEVVNSRHERGDVKVKETTIRRDRQLIIHFGWLQE